MIPIHVHVLLFYDDLYIVICFISTAKVCIIYQTEGYKILFNGDKSIKPPYLLIFPSHLNEHLLPLHIQYLLCRNCTHK